MAVFGFAFSPEAVQLGSLTLARPWGRWGLHLRERWPFGIHQEVVEELYLLLHLLNFISVLVQNMLPHKLRALQRTRAAV